jgi:hypothetical protein
MQKIIFISILVAMLASISGNAKAQTLPVKKSDSEFANYLKKQLHDFEWARIIDEDMTVRLYFEYTHNNKIVILKDSIDNNCVIWEYIQKEFDKKEYSGNDLIPGHSYSMKVNLVLK